MILTNSTAAEVGTSDFVGTKEECNAHIVKEVLSWPADLTNND